MDGVSAFVEAQADRTNDIKMITEKPNDA